MNDIFVSLIFLITGTVVMCVIFFVKQKNKKILENGIEVEGVINGFENIDGLSNNSRFPIIRFQTQNGVLITEKANIALPPFILKEGQKVKVIYKIDNPKDFILKTSFDFSKLFYLFLLLSIVFISLGILGVYKYLITE
jgi:hypothetical protein